MIKVTFKEPLYMKAELGMCDAIFVLCKSVEYEFTNFCFVDGKGTFFVNTPAMARIKSIEHVKPTDL